VLVVVLVASSLKLLGVPTAVVGALLLACAVLAAIVGTRAVLARRDERRSPPPVPAALAEPRAG